MLELDSVFLVDERSVLVVVVQVVMNLWGMEFPWVAQRLASDWAAVLAGDTTLIVPKVVHIVLSAVFLKLSEALFSV